MTPADVALAEYSALKAAEQSERIKTRDNLIYATLISVGALGAFIVQTGTWHLLLAGPYPTLVLGWLYLSNDDVIARLRNYFRDSLRHDLAAQISPAVYGEQLLRWESQPRARGWHMWRIGSLVFNVLVFIAPPAAALTAWAVLYRPLSPAAGVPAGLLAAFFAGVLLTAGLLYVVLHNSLHRHRGGPARRDATVAVPDRKKTHA